VNAAGRYLAPLAEKTEDELILAIRKQATDEAAALDELVRRGWTLGQVLSRVRS